jgi:hypothetical protein
VDPALRALGKSKQTQRVRREVTSGVKRKNVDEESEDPNVAGTADAAETPNAHQAYNTRFKGVKRVKMGREIPEGFPYSPHRRGRAPRKSAPAALAPPSRTTTNENGSRKAESVKRNPRGRPRKNLSLQVVSSHSSGIPKAGRPPSSTKQVFDGVVVVKRTHPPKRAELDNTDASHPDPDADAEGDMDGDAEEIVAPHPGELNGLIGVAGENNHSEANQGDSSVP